ncbi:cytochrome c oxidase subunit 3 family protein [Mycobacterium avium subsp. hominissuis]|uniref:Probable cytochrome c oxidase subunit 3 n=1 Tax=Mycobacterium bouchedurhonense TaxID=701041 RepID=A0AAW5S3W1_MYCBC|nr:cytochrome c oxidase subunit 3 family protein [Mycobacterium avium]MBZ4502211.1 cytochrome c oxidase subunit 3 family protein [Mycobacterium avium subsp. hominissuis]MCV6990130.1 cytochrome c oxidase subunit 3 [Mycobacterium bouchedurhonense]MCV6997168.1 cytochrome c oxidase subunit 3 [Mycobacterium timonense]MBZ4520541.1 cytochrome c oxidase subunit 3 family protein [Mycobacterium avium subsp. hominissuis]
MGSSPSGSPHRVLHLASHRLRDARQGRRRRGRRARQGGGRTDTGTGGVNQTALGSAGVRRSNAAEAARRVPGEPGVWIFLFGDMAVFGVFFATFMYQRSLAPKLFDDSRHTRSIGIGLNNTLVLLTSSLFVVTAMRAIRSSQRGPAQLAGALICGLAFVGLKAVEYAAKVSQGHVPTQNNFCLYYFILTGLHLFHVLIGVAVLILLFFQGRRTELSPTRTGLVEGGACFRHLVDLL